MAPRRIDMVAARRSTLIVWSDAMYESTTGSLGFVAFDPDTGRYYYSAYRVPDWVYSFFRVLKTYIGQLEIFAVLFVYLTLPARITSRRPVLHYIDNTSSMAGAIKGYSPKSDSSWMLTLLHLIFALLEIAPWFAYVASKANCSDGPSRFDFSFARTVLCATWLEPVSLTPAQWASPLRNWINSPPLRRPPLRARSSLCTRALWPPTPPFALSPRGTPRLPCRPWRRPSSGPSSRGWARPVPRDDDRLPLLLLSWRPIPTPSNHPLLSVST